MKPPILLKTILDICFYLLLLSFLSAVFIAVITAFMGGESIPVEINGRIISEFTPIALIVIFSELFLEGLLVYTVYILRKLIRNFFKRKLFTRYQIASLNLIGRLIIIITLGQGLINFITKIFFEAKLFLGIEVNLSFISFWFILAIGLFFIYLSKIFENARHLREDNEYTV